MVSKVIVVLQVVCKDRHIYCYGDTVFKFNKQGRPIMENSFARKKRGDTSAAREKDQQDLCTFCFAAPHCTLVNSSARLVLECEEFRAYDPKQERDGSEEAPPRAGSAGGSRYGRERPERLKNNGLCGDCAIYDTCPFPKNRGEVWCCEEYR